MIETNKPRNLLRGLPDIECQQRDVENATFNAIKISNDALLLQYIG